MLLQTRAYTILQRSYTPERGITQPGTVLYSHIIRINQSRIPFYALTKPERTTINTGNENNMLVGTFILHSGITPQ